MPFHRGMPQIECLRYMNTSRTAKSLQNVKVALLFYFLNLFLQFFSRKIFLDYLGSEVLGLNTTAQNLLGFLNLAELGIGSAVAYNLYKPLFEGNCKVINDIVSVQGWLYRRIACIVILGAIVLMCFFPLMFAKAQVPLWYAYGSFIALLISALLGYFVNYRQIVLSADQKEYRITFSVQGVKIIKVILQLLAIRYLNNGYAWWMGLEVAMAFVTSYALDRSIRKEYPWLKISLKEASSLRKKYPDVIRKTKQLFCHKIAGFVLLQTSPLVLYCYSSLTLVAIYGNYMLIVTGVLALANALLNSINAGVGNLIAEGDLLKIKSVFWEITTLRMWMASIICFGLYIFGDSFICLWVGCQYIMPKSAYILLILITFIQLTRTSETFLNGYGLFKDIWAPMAEAFLNLGLSILLGYFYGLTGILAGVLISLLLIVNGWKPYFLYKSGFKGNIAEYVFLYCKKLILLFLPLGLIVTFIKHNIVLPNDSYVNFFVSIATIIPIYAVLSFLPLYFFDRQAKLLLRRGFRLVIKH